MRDDYLLRDAVGLAELVRRREVSPRELLETAIALAEERNDAINALVVPFFERAVDEAEELPEGPFRGVPFLLKDLYAALAGVPLTNGSHLYEGFVPQWTSEVVERYRRAGLAIFGRTASPEFGVTTTTESRLHGATRNPWNLEHSAGGSSGGAAAAVAAGIVPAAHASDGGGSIRIPASCCGLVGLKPSRGRVSFGPEQGEGWAGMSIHHVVSRTVRDSAALLDVIAGNAPGDPYSAPHQERPFREEAGRDPGRLQVAWTTHAFNDVDTDPECVAAVESTARRLEALGHVVEEARPAIDGDALADAARVIVGTNLRLGLEQRARQLGKTLEPNDVEPITWSTATSVDDRPLTAYPSAVNMIHAIGRSLGRFFGSWDLLLSPTMPAPPQRIGALALDHPEPRTFLANLKRTIGYTQLMNAAGNPAISLPLHWSEQGLPVGVQLAAPLGGEPALIRVASQLEQAAPWSDRRPAIG
ncbi:MAG TPA: amidase [Thermoanaerobaculia bacterium]|nr:amidase [Thermoanaerobaculia bacterium]